MALTSHSVGQAACIALENEQHSALRLRARARDVHCAKKHETTARRDTLSRSTLPHHCEIAMRQRPIRPSRQPNAAGTATLEVAIGTDRMRRSPGQPRKSTSFREVLRACGRQAASMDAPALARAGTKARRRNPSGSSDPKNPFIDAGELFSRRIRHSV